MPKLVFDKPARNWYEALPIGDGKTAVMVYGGRRKETLCFNDAELWSGYPKNYDNAHSPEALAKARELIKEGKYNEAAEVVANDMQGDYSEAFMPLARLSVKFQGNGGISNLNKYKRTLDMENGFLIINDGVTVRKAFVSHKKNLMVYSIVSNKAVSYEISGSSLLRYTLEAEGDKLFVSGVAPDYAAPHYLGKIPNAVCYDEGKAMAFALAVRVETDGSVTVKEGKTLNVASARHLRIYATTETGFKGYDKMPSNDVNEVKGKAFSRLASVDIMNYDGIREEHTADYRSIWDKEKISIAKGDGNVPKLLAMARHGKLKSELVNLLYDYGKYMTICGSRGTQPLNLQGQWNDEVRPPWSSNLTTNINAQMNYWGASRAGLQECIAPFYKAVDEMADRGKNTAKVNFGARGFTVNHNVDIWRMTSPVQGDPSYMYSPLCGAWLAAEYFEHKRNSGTIDAGAINVVSESARFILDYLYEQDGKLVVSPSVSPETSFVTDSGRSPVGISSAFELSVIRQIFADCLACDADEELKAEIREALAKLAPYEKADNGIAEWSGGKVSAEKGHRHFSPLYGVYPGNVIEEGTPEFEWVNELFRYRRANSNSPIGWSAAWAMCLAARFRDKEAAESIMKAFAARSIMNNLFDYHPPRYFQIDGNFGFLAAIHEMILREHRDGSIELLPAIPNILKSGKAENLVVRGIKVSFEWKDGKVIKVSSDKPIEVFARNLAIDVRVGKCVTIIN